MLTPIGEAEEIYELAVDLIESEADKGGPIKPKKEIRTIRPASLSSKTYLETEEDAEEFVTAMKEAIIKAVQEQQTGADSVGDSFQ